MMSKEPRALIEDIVALISFTIFLTNFLCECNEKGADKPDVMIIDREIFPICLQPSFLRTLLLYVPGPNMSVPTLVLWSSDCSIASIFYQHVKRDD